LSSRRQQYLLRLGLSPDASIDDVKKAYRILAKRLHPDLNPSPGAEKQFIEVQEAYEYLTRPDVPKRNTDTPEDFIKKQKAKEKSERDRLKSEAKKRAKEAAQRMAATLLMINGFLSIPIYLSLLINLFLVIEWLLPLKQTQRPLIQYVTHVNDYMTKEKTLSYYFYLQFDQQVAVVEGDLSYRLESQVQERLNVSETQLSGVIRSVELQTSNGLVWINCASYFFNDFAFLMIIVGLLGLLFILMPHRNRLKIHVAIGTIMMIFVEMLALLVTPY
jgi:methyl-accepting chemotaxis protein